ncbi:efflux RND transporter periplasmic adaptor subunit [Methylosinus sp. Ce-a6]|uniref:efflux RND transporter periplasmic adaptor subunit n=1 Tax=Methylosinus sp. Ce-a6 TaxID=2172005 RepID=UPI0013568FEA|nr:efflux RND transporter periplasmic adaptor subunit [Methylosinus sp. Ce-a6]
MKSPRALPAWWRAKRPSPLVALATVAALAAGFYVARPWLFGEAGVKERSAAESRREGRRRGFDGPVAITATPVRVDDVPVTIDAVGAAQALNTVTVRTQVDGRLIKLAFEEGQNVNKGDIVALIEPTLYQAAYDQAVAKKAQDEANLANARVDVTRYQKLAASNYGSQQQYATQQSLVVQLEAQLRADQGAIDNAKATLDYATIRSPIDGRTGIRLVDVGNILHSSDATGIVVITQLEPIYVVFTVPQQFLPALQKAQARAPAAAAALGPDNASVLDTGLVSVIDNQIDQATGTVKVKATFENKGLALWPGQFVNVRVTVDVLRDARVVPSAAVQRGPNGAFVYVLNEDETVSMRPVAVGRQDEAQAVIVSGLEVGEKVATTGFARLVDGSQVRAMEPTEDGGAGGPPNAPATLRKERRREAGGERRGGEGGPPPQAR